MCIFLCSRFRNAIDSVLTRGPRDLGSSCILQKEDVGVFPEKPVVATRPNRTEFFAKTRLCDPQLRLATGPVGLIAGAGVCFEKRRNARSLKSRGALASRKRREVLLCAPRRWHSLRHVPYLRGYDGEARHGLAPAFNDRYLDLDSFRGAFGEKSGQAHARATVVGAVS